MKLEIILGFVLLCVISCTEYAQKCKPQPSRPNIVLMIGDDMGWNDVSFHGSNQILTPNLDLMALTGIPFERYYSHCICTPTRSALLTGKFSYTLGMQGLPLLDNEDRGIPLTEKLLPQYFKELGYATHLIGKWHVGQARTKFLPTSRGFDTHFGHRGGYIDYYEYTLEQTWLSSPITGYDLFRNLTPVWKEEEGYITDLYNNEAKSVIMSHDNSKPLFLVVSHNAPHSGNDGALMQAPPEVVRSKRYIESTERRYLAGMIKKLDDSVGDVVQTLSKKGILDNTIIAFISDNGGMTSGLHLNYASNWPLRGLKMSPFEGGVRVNGLLWSQNITKTNHLWNGYMHVVDWLPTLLSAAGGTPPANIDGLDLWKNIIDNKASKRNEMFEFDDITGYYSIILDDYKLVTGKVVTNYSTYQGQDLRGIIGEPPSYSDTLRKSTMFSVLRDIGSPFNFKATQKRNKLTVDCNKMDQDNINLCFPDNTKGCLYNIKTDPCETQDLSNEYPEIVEKLLKRLQMEKERIIPRVLPGVQDPRSLPRNNNYAWDVWADNVTPKSQ